MKYLIQFLIILGISFLGELLHSLIPLPIPASIYGMVLLFAALSLRLIRVEQVRDTGHFLVNIMSVLFVCPAVGLLKCWDLIRTRLLGVTAVILLSLVITFAVSGKVTQYLLQKKEERHG